MSNDLKEKIKKEYWACQECHQKAGGVFPEGHVCTVKRGECPICEAQSVYLIPWIDCNWPRDERFDLIAKTARD